MSVSAAIDLELSTSSDRVSAKKVLMTLHDFGWSFDDHGNVSYLPVGDQDDFDWQSEKMSVENLLEIVEAKEQRGELIGVTITWKDTGIGGQLLLQSDGTMTFSITVNRKCIDEETRITDVNWYLMRLLLPLNQNGFYVAFFQFSEHV
jgi:hypothetical protein